ncbi:MAG: putative NH(3)-dependent NAD(+) synthetase [Candidatus Bathyarchaeota archaeon BA1]|nr:MAG: putative NH(3)-dependent NAD(+) synthetase [Candidatus Bathyarchaeota archaeon BA1]
MKKLGKDIPKLDFERTTNEIVEFIRKTVKDANAAGVVVGLSGGVDSSLVAALCVRALGENRVLGVIMPMVFTPSEDIEDAKGLAEWLGIRTELVNIQDISEALSRRLGIDQNDPKQRIPMANIRARIRMVILYYYANLHNYLVAGAGDRSERLIGYFTKYGDGGVDFSPISHLYKTQVRELSKHLGIPDKIAYKPSSPQLYPGHKVTDEIPLGYEELDPVLVGLFDHKLPPREVSRLTGVPVKAVEEILRRFERSKHKRTYPPMVRE